MTDYSTRETVAGALFAGAISFGNAIVALFANDSTLTLDTVGQAAWISMGLGCVIQFAKDYQAISTRRMLNKLRKNV